MHFLLKGAGEIVIPFNPLWEECRFHLWLHMREHEGGALHSGTRLETLWVLYTSAHFALALPQFKGSVAAGGLQVHTQVARDLGWGKPFLGVRSPRQP